LQLLLWCDCNPALILIATSIKLCTEVCLTKMSAIDAMVWLQKLI
jgi:hypothetical protein